MGVIDIARKAIDGPVRVTIALSKLAMMLSILAKKMRIGSVKSSDDVVDFVHRAHFSDFVAIVLEDTRHKTIRNNPPRIFATFSTHEYVGVCIDRVESEVDVEY